MNFRVWVMLTTVLEHTKPSVRIVMQFEFWSKYVYACLDISCMEVADILVSCIPQ